jgi:hypothetical protein
MSILEQQAFQQEMPLWQENWIWWSPSTMVGTTGLCGNGTSGLDISHLFESVWFAKDTSQLTLEVTPLKTRPSPS